MSQGLQKEPYKIGACLPLTGYLSWIGEYRKKAAELKVDMINEAGGVDGHPLKLIVYDDKSSPEIGMTIAQRLISQDMVVAVTGTASVPIRVLFLPCVINSSSCNPGVRLCDQS
jgi:branched-chain amino acid transport system substrate-binding protein